MTRSLWRQTPLTVADVLCERYRQSPTGYCLRRHAIWQTITSAPQAETGGRTSRAAFPVDSMADYQATLTAAKIELWEHVEKSAPLDPQWFLTGTALPVRTATQLGFHDTAVAIRDELISFINRIPVLWHSQFTDLTPHQANRPTAGLLKTLH